MGIATVKSRKSGTLPPAKQPTSSLREQIPDLLRMLIAQSFLLQVINSASKQLQSIALHARGSYSLPGNTHFKN